MNLRDRMRLLLRTMFHDLFGEGEAFERLEGQEHGLAQLDAAQARLDTLRVDLTGAEAREARLELEYQQAQAAAEQAGAAVDEALRQGNEEDAASRQAQTSRLENQARQLHEALLASRQATTSLQAAVRTLQTHIDDARQQYKAISEREQSAETLEELSRLERVMRKEGASLQEGLSQRQEQVAQREDRLAARADLRRRAGGDDR